MFLSYGSSKNGITHPTRTWFEIVYYVLVMHNSFLFAMNYSKEKELFP